MDSDNKASATSGKRKRSELYWNDEPSILIGTSTQDGEVSRDETFSDLRVQQRNTDSKHGKGDRLRSRVKKKKRKSEGYDPGISLRIERGTEDGRDIDEGMSSGPLNEHEGWKEEGHSRDGSLGVSLKRNKKIDGSCRADSINSYIQIEGNQKKNCPDERNTGTSMPNEDESNRSISTLKLCMIERRDKSDEGIIPDYDMNDSLDNRRTSIEKVDEHLDVNNALTNIFIGSNNCRTLTEEFEQEKIPEQNFSKLVRKRRRLQEYPVDMSSIDGVWASSLKGPHLELMVSLKHLAEVRLTNLGERSLVSCLTPTALRTIGIILEELIKDHVSSTLHCLNVKP